MTEINNDDLAAACEQIAGKHLSTSDRTTLTANGAKSMLQPDADRATLHADAARLMKTGDPRSPAAMDLARRG